MAKLRASPEDDPKIVAEFDDIDDAAKEAERANLGFRDFVKRPEYRPQLFWSLVFMCCQQFTGMNAIMVCMRLWLPASVTACLSDCLLAQLHATICCKIVDKVNRWTNNPLGHAVL